MTSTRQYSTTEVAAYLTACGILCACFNVERWMAIPTICVFVLPGILVAGPMGLAIGGRKWFWPSALFGFIIWGEMFLTPAVTPAR